MSRQTLTRVLLVVLAVLAVGVVARRAAPVPEPDAALSFGTKWDVEELRHRTIQVNDEGPISITAVGSFGARTQDRHGAQLAVFGWIVRRSDGVVVWQMTPEAARRLKGDGGTLAEVTDRITLAPGLYDAYFSTYGFDEDDHFFNRAPWKADRDRWRFRLDDGGRGVIASGERDDGYADAAGRGTGLDVIYRTGPVTSRTERAVYLRVEQPVRVRLQSVGEVPRGGDEGYEQQDYAFFQNVYTGQPVWEMTRDATEPAGGHPRNRAADAVVTLEPGLYRAGYRTDGGHGPNDWWMAPPLDPLGWGLTVSYADPKDVGSGAVAEADVRHLPTVAELAPLGDDVRRARRFEVTDSLRVLAVGLGELRSGNRRYDYAWLIREGDAGRPAETVWDMTYESSEPAGGESRNRRTESALTLAPGLYTLHAQTDDSHSADGWHDRPPHDAEHWGATLYAFDTAYAGAPATEIRIDRADGEDWSVPAPRAAPAPPAPPTPAPAPAPAASAGSLVQAFSSLPDVQPLPVRLLAPGANARLAASFELRAPTRVRVAALGELSLSDRYDYGWIERVEDGRPAERVWEMTMDNAVYAGGMRRNRLAEATLDLPAGRYVARFVTDAQDDPSSLAPDAAPRNPERYGLTVERAD